MSINELAGMNVTKASDREFEAVRVYDAPQDLVFEVWTTCEHLKKWWGPREWPVSSCEMDFRVGGAWYYCMRGPDGQESCGKALYHEIDRPHRILYTDYFVDGDGNPLQGMPEVESSVLFEEYGGRTKVTTRGRYATAEALQQVLDMGMIEGMTETTDRLVEYLASLQA